MEFKLILGYNCNLKCSYCYQNNCSDKNMGYDVIDKFLERFNKLKGTHTINFFGGEPLIYADKIKYIIEKIDKKHNLSITTNGTMRGKFYELQELWGKEISNMLSNKEHKDYTKLNSLSFFRFVVTKDNISELTEELIYFLAKHYGKNLQFKYALNEKWELHEVQKMEQVQRQLQSILGINFRIDLPVNYNSCLDCFVSNTVCFINYNGDYLACHRNINSKIGNIFDEDFVYCNNSTCIDEYTAKNINNLYSYGNYEFKGTAVFHSCN